MGEGEREEIEQAPIEGQIDIRQAVKSSATPTEQENPLSHFISEYDKCLEEITNIHPLDQNDREEQDLSIITLDNLHAFLNEEDLITSPSFANHLAFCKEAMFMIECMDTDNFESDYVQLVIQAITDELNRGKKHAEDQAKIFDETMDLDTKNSNKMEWENNIGIGVTALATIAAIGIGLAGAPWIAAAAGVIAVIVGVSTAINHFLRQSQHETRLEKKVNELSSAKAELDESCNDIKSRLNNDYGLEATYQQEINLASHNSTIFLRGGPIDKISDDHQPDSDNKQTPPNYNNDPNPPAYDQNPKGYNGP